ncbi:zinc finger protein 771-like isoform X2 [Nerophis ophidion]|uniref:zinc finger protein 771-like isoform X2 n=1 Tax=Nerophis ophidion TaxID=159077 RepID=UPI002ADF97FF|nr:zinc finger protein 771-like isoform X2 [Nerophis ophidion]
MVQVRMLRMLMEQRLKAVVEEIFGLFERTVAEYEEELSRSKKENERQRQLLDQARLQSPENQQESVKREAKISFEQQEWSSNVWQDEPPPSCVKEEEEEPWKQLQILEEANVTMLTSAAVFMRSQDDKDDEGHSLHLHHSQSEENTGAEPPNHCMTTEGVGDDTSESSETELSDEDKEPLDDVQEVSSESQEEIPSEQQEWSSSVGQNELEPPHIKEEGDELWEQLQRLEEANDRDEAQALQLDYSPSEENRGAELLTRHITADGEHREDINSEPDSIFAPLSDSSESNQSDNIQKPLENNRNSEDVMRHHADKKHYNCSECGKSLRHKSLFTAHMRIHTGEKPFACSDCPKRFSTNDNLKKHTHVHGAGKPFACSVCSKSLSSQRHLKRHMMIHTGENPFPCSVCPKRVKTKSQLILHMRTHTGERPFTCSVCSKGFTSKASMTHHMKSHMREEQFTCPLCPKRYTKNAALMAHMRTHTGERPFSCNVCGTRFRYKYQVKRHKCSADLDAVGQCGSGDRAVIQNF